MPDQPLTLRVNMRCSFQLTAKDLPDHWAYTDAKTEVIESIIAAAQRESIDKVVQFHNLLYQPRTVLQLTPVPK
jgi:hypothetical protein